MTFLIVMCTGSYAGAQANAAPTTNAASSGTKGVCPSEFLGDDREVSPKKIFPNILCDQKRIWTFPWRLAHGKDVLPTAAVLGVTAGLIALDPTEARYFRRTSSFHHLDHVVSGVNTGLVIALVPTSFYAVGLIHRDSYAQHTALLAGEAVADAEIVSVVMKDVDRRLTPLSIPQNGNFSDTWFKRNGKWWAANGAFPSGHEVAAFSVATVIARRYGTHKWVPYVAYGAVGLVSFSRLTLSAHFASDIFMGAALGYSITRFVVLR